MKTLLKIKGHARSDLRLDQILHRVTHISVCYIKLTTFNINSVFITGK